MLRWRAVVEKTGESQPSAQEADATIKNASVEAEAVRLTWVMDLAGSDGSMAMEVAPMKKQRPKSESNPVFAGRCRRAGVEIPHPCLQCALTGLRGGGVLLPGYATRHDQKLLPISQLNKDSA